MVYVVLCRKLRGTFFASLSLTSNSTSELLQFLFYQIKAVPLSGIFLLLLRM